MNELTMLVMVRDRHYNVENLMEYYKDIDCRKIIVDSSVEKKSFDLGEFEHFYVGPMDVYRKMSSCLDTVSTNFCVVLCDDDLILKSSLRKCYYFLVGNPSYSMCDGEIYSYNGSRICPKHAEANAFQIANDFTSDSCLERLSFFFGCYYGKNYSVCRTNVIKTAYRSVIDNDAIRPVNFWDRVFTMTGIISGNSKVMPIPYIVRKHGDRMINSEHIRKEYGFGIWMKDNLDMIHLYQFADMISKHEGISVEKSFDKLRNILNAHFLDHLHLYRLNGGSRGYRYSIEQNRFKDQICELTKHMKFR